MQKTPSIDKWRKLISLLLKILFTICQREKFHKLNSDFFYQLYFYVPTFKEIIGVVSHLQKQLMLWQ